MRKGFVFLLVVLLLFLGIVYLAIPNTINISERGDLSVNEKAFARVFFNEAAWPQWWPVQKDAGSNLFTGLVYKDKKYRLLEKRFTSLLMSVSQGQDSVSTELFLVPVRAGRVEIAWVCALPTTANPVERVKRYFLAKSLAADLHSLLQHVQTFYANDDKIYGYPIRETIVIDSLLVSTAATQKNKPTTEDVYGLVDKLKAFIEKSGAAATSEPMLNVSSLQKDSAYLIRVAIPVNKHLTGEGDVAFKQMLGKGNILVTTVQGGPWQVEEAFKQMDLFVIENNRTAPAIPFQKLITDRRTERDTSKWMTKIYWPVM